MLIAVALVPGPPLLVPELVGSAAAETADLREAVVAAGKRIADADRWVAVGVAGPGESTGEFGPATVGTYRGFGAEVIVRLGSTASAADSRAGDSRTGDSPSGDSSTVGPHTAASSIAASSAADPLLPLPVLTVGWMREQVAPAVSAHVLVVAETPDAAERDTAVTTLRGMVGAPDEQVGLIVVGDGARTLTERAPGGFDPDAGAVQERIDDLLAAGDLAGVAHLDGQACSAVGIGSVAAWQVAAAAVDANGPDPVATELYRGHPFGVGYWVGTWVPEAA